MKTKKRGLTLGAAAVTGFALLSVVGGAPAHTAAVPECQGVRATLVGTSGHDTLRGTPRRDVIVGLAGDDVIHGFGGNDLICGGPGNDELVGGAGKDVLLGGDGADRLVGGAGNDVLRGGSGALVHVNIGDDEVEQRTFGDHLNGGPGNDVLDVRGDEAAELLFRPPVLSFAGGKAVRIDVATGRATGQGRDTLLLPGRRAARLTGPRVAVVGSLRGDSVIDAGAKVQRSSGPVEVFAGPGRDRLTNVVDLDDRRTLAAFRRGEAGPLGRGSYTSGQEWFGRATGNDVIRLASGGGHVVLTGGKDRVFGSSSPDEVTLVGSGRPVVRLRAGADKVRVEANGAFGDLDLGTGKNSFELTRVSSANHLKIDARNGVVRGSGKQLGRVRGAREYVIGSYGRLTFRGSAAAEILRPWNQSSLVANMGAGDDMVFASLIRPVAGIDGGPGNDLVSLRLMTPSGESLFKGECRNVERGTGC